MFIQNCSIAEIKSGQHFDCGDRAILIQICDPATEFPTPKYKFEKTFRFRFLDIEDEDSILGEFAISDSVAKILTEILRDAFEERRNVIVHCHAGMCRSGAVVEVGIIMGFTDTEKFRLPNRLVKSKMMKALGLTYDSNETFKLPETDSGIIIASMSDIHTVHIHDKNQ